MTSTPRNTLSRPRLIRTGIPVALFFVVLFYETWEHMLITGSFKIDIHWTSEILFFGIIGPTGVYLVLTYITRLLEEQIQVSNELESFNRTLEEKVQERTETLELRNQELAQANTELQELDRMKSDFVSLVSHELRGPLTTLNGGLELAIQNADQLSPESRRILDVLAHESGRLTEFVQTILDVSRLDAGILNLNFGPVAVEPFLRRLVELVFAAEGREVVFELPASLPPMWADEIYFEKVICNLLTNADKYSPTEEPILLSAAVEDDELIISVTDHGPGIPLASQENVFQRFQRLESGDNMETQGWGLGLYFSRAITEAHHGVLSLQSPVHNHGQAKGSSFQVRIPIAKEAPENG